MLDDDDKPDRWNGQLPSEVNRSAREMMAQDFRQRAALALPGFLMEKPMSDERTITKAKLPESGLAEVVTEDGVVVFRFDEFIKLSQRQGAVVDFWGNVRHVTIH